MALNANHRKFLEIYARNGGHATQALRDAGWYQGNPKATGIRVHAFNILHKPDSQEYLHQLLLASISSHAPFAIDAIRHLAEHAESESVRLAACKELLDRGGFKLAERHEFVLKDERTTEEIEASIRAHVQELGLDAAGYVLEGEVVGSS